MKQYAWYSPEFDVIVLQYSTGPHYFFSFEWGIEQAWDMALKVGTDCDDPMQETLWFPLGEL